MSVCQVCKVSLRSSPVMTLSLRNSTMRDLDKAWYQLAQAPSPAPSLSGGGSTGSPEVVGFSPLPVEAGLLLWWGLDVFLPWLEVDDFPPWPEVDDFPPWPEVDDFLPWPEVDDFLPWPEVDDFLPWSEVDDFLPRSGVGWAPS